MAERTTTINAALAGTIDLGGDLTVNRFGFGAMRYGVALRLRLFFCARLFCALLRHQ